MGTLHETTARAATGPRVSSGHAPSRRQSPLPVHDRPTHRLNALKRRQARGAGNLIVPVICPALHRSGDIYRFAGASDTDVQQAHFLNKPVWHFLRIHDPASIRRTRAHTSTFAPRTNPSRPIETRNARNENGVPLEPLSGVNGHDRDICIKVIRETPQGALGKDAHDIVETLRRAHRDAVICKVFPLAFCKLTAERLRCEVFSER